LSLTPIINLNPSRYHQSYSPIVLVKKQDTNIIIFKLLYDILIKIW